MKMISYTIRILSMIGIIYQTNVHASIVDVPVTTSLGTISYIDSNISSAQSVSGTAGMSIGVLLANGSSETVVFNGSSATGTGWSLSNSGLDTWTTQWILTNSSSSSAIVGLILDAKTGNAAFDIVIPNDPFGTIGTIGFGSGQGGFEAESAYGFSALYSNAVAINGTVAVGDLFSSLNISMNALSTGSYAFKLDTDAVNYTSISAVPVPAAFWLFGSGLIGLATVARTRKKTS